MVKKGIEVHSIRSHLILNARLCYRGEYRLFKIKQKTFYVVRINIYIIYLQKQGILYFLGGCSG